MLSFLQPLSDTGYFPASKLIALSSLFKQPWLRQHSLSTILINFEPYNALDWRLSEGLFLPLAWREASRI